MRAGKRRPHLMCALWKSICELGVGYNTPGIIKYNFWQYAANWQNAFYICINQGQAYLPEDIEDKGLAVNADIMQILEGLL